MEWLFDPAAWISLVTLTILEIVLGIDNLVFIAILADKLPKHQQNKARVTGLGLAMFVRIAMLCTLSWLVTLTQPLFTVFSHPFSGRDIILFIGGGFLLYKATSELHERLEGVVHHESTQKKVVPGFWVVVAQIIVLDIVFSLDSVVTAVGIASHLPVMMAAIVIAVIIMMWMQKPITDFVNAHKTVVILCLAFLLMIGVSLIAESFSFEIPKGYLYAAIGFSVMIEFFNQVGQYKMKKQMAKIPLRERTANAVLFLLGGKSEVAELSPEAQSIIEDRSAFGEKERDMVSGVLTLGERTIRSIMTPRHDIVWVDMTKKPELLLDQLRKISHSYYPVCDGKLDSVKGIAKAQNIIDDLHLYGKIQPDSIHDAVVIPESVEVLQAIDLFKSKRGQVGLVVDEYGSIEGLVTHIDVLEVIAGDFPDEDDSLKIKEISDGTWEIDGSTDLYSIEHALETDGLVDGNQEYSTLNGLILDHLGTVPVVGQAFEYHGFRFEVVQMVDQRIETVKITRIEPSDA